MSILKFDDGVTIDTSGPLRVVLLKDGYGVVGKGMWVPVVSYEEGENFIRKLEAKSNPETMKNP